LFFRAKVKSESNGALGFFYERNTKMKNFLNKYNATKLETTKDESQLSLEGYKRRILNLLDQNMIHFKNHSWNLSNRMNKLIIDSESNSVFTLRLGGKRIVRYSLEYLNNHQKLEFLSDFYASVEQGDFDEDIINFIAEEKEKAYRRKQESNAKRREKKRATYAMSETRPSNPVQVRFDDTIETKSVYVPRYETL